MKEKDISSFVESIAIGRKLPDETNAHRLVRLFQDIANMDKSVVVTCIQLPEKDFNLLYITNKKKKKG